MADVYYIKGMKKNLMIIGQLLLEGYRVYMEDNHFVIKDISPSNQLIERLQMTSNHLFPLRIRPYIKEKTTQVVHEAKNVKSKVVFKAERKEADKHDDKEEKQNAQIQATFQAKV